MTAVAALVSDGRVYMGADSGGVSGWLVEARVDPKVFVNGPFVMGFTTSFRMGQLLRWSFDPPEQHADVEVERFMVTTFVDAVRECFKAGGLAKKEAEVESGGDFSVGYHGRLFTVLADYQVEEVTAGFTGIGSGRELILGSLHSTEGRTPRERLSVALEAAARFNIGVRGPFVYEVSPA